MDHDLNVDPFINITMFGVFWVHGKFSKLNSMIPQNLFSFKIVLAILFALHLNVTVYLELAQILLELRIKSIVI